MVVSLFFVLSMISLLLALDKGPDEFPVVSYKNLEIKEFNMQIASAEKKEAWIFNPLSIAMRFHKVSDLRFVDINQKNDRAECPLRSVITIVEEGFLDDQMRGRWTQFYLGREDCTKAWNVKELRQAYLCGMVGSREVFLKELCPETKARTVTDVWVEMTPASADVPCDYFPYTFDVKFRITVDGPSSVTFQRMRSDGSVAPKEVVIFSEAGTKEFQDYFRVGATGDYWFKVKVTYPNKISGQALAKVICY